MAQSVQVTRTWKRGAGELVLIIVGVLVALWIEEWRQARIDGATEIQYLERLVADLEEDVRDLGNQIKHTEWRERNALNALAFLDGTGPGDRATLEAFNIAGFIGFFRHNRATMDDLLSTGSLALLSNKDLVRDLNNYYRSTDFLYEFDDVKKVWVWEGFRGDLDAHIPSIVMADLGRRLEGDDADTSEIDWEGLRSDPIIRNGLGRILGIARVERRNLRRALDAARELKATIQTEHAALSS